MVRAGALPLAPPTPTPHTILYQSSHRELDEGLMWVKRGQGWDWTEALASKHSELREQDVPA